MEELKQSYDVLPRYEEVYPMRDDYNDEPYKASVILVPHQQNIIREHNFTAKHILLAVSALVILFVITLGTFAANWESNVFNNTSTPCDQDALVKVCRARVAFLEKRLLERTGGAHPRLIREMPNDELENAENLILKERLRACQDKNDSVLQELRSRIEFLEKAIKSGKFGQKTVHYRVINLSNGSTLIHNENINISGDSQLIIGRSTQKLSSVLLPLLLLDLWLER